MGLRQWINELITRKDFHMGEDWIQVGWTSWTVKSTEIVHNNLFFFYRKIDIYNIKKHFHFKRIFILKMSYSRRRS
jgi:hypothetical protein